MNDKEISGSGDDDPLGQSQADLRYTTQGLTGQSSFDGELRAVAKEAPTKQLEGSRFPRIRCCRLTVRFKSAPAIYPAIGISRGAQNRMSGIKAGTEIDRRGARRMGVW